MRCVWFHLAAPQLSPQKAQAAASIRGALTVKKHIIKNLTREECGEEDGNRNRHFLRLWLIEWGLGWAQEKLAGAWSGLGNWGSSLPSKDDLGCLRGCSSAAPAPGRPQPPQTPSISHSELPFMASLYWACSVLFLEAWGDDTRVLAYPSLPLVCNRLLSPGPLG